MSFKTLFGAVVSSVLVVSAAGQPGAPAAAPGSPPVPPPAATRTTGAPRTVTLVTGDRVTVRPGRPDRPVVEAGAGRAGTTFLVRVHDGHLRVVPGDALPLLLAGRLDPRLFDVTTLLRFGYDRRAGLPLILTYRGGAARMPSTVAKVRDLPAVDGVAVTQPRAGAVGFWRALAARAADRAGAPALGGGITKVWLDGLRRPTLDVSVPRIGAPRAWAAGLTGAGVRVAVVDTGIDAGHPDLAGRVVAGQDFTGERDSVDHVGHGTHVASTIAGSGAASGGRYRGVAPDARLVDAKVCTLDGCEESAILAGMQWAAAEQRARIVNLSLGGPDSPEVDPVEQAVATLTGRYGTLFVAAAGNDGADGAVDSPASADDALAVGAVTKADALADFSNRGPRVGDLAIKPDITAPGVDITAARGRDGVVGAPGELYATLSGTSMATPHVAGSAAILAQQHPDWTPAQLRSALMAAATPAPEIDVYAQGAGRVDVGRAVHQAVLATPASVSFPFQDWPHTDDRPVTTTVSYHNGGAAPVTLDLTVHAGAASGMFTVRPGRVTVPAGGRARVGVTADTRTGPVGRLGGQLIATGDGVVVRTPLAVVKEAEAYDVTLTQLDRTGRPATVYDTILLNPADGSSFDLSDPSGTGTVRVPPARYLLTSTIITGDGPRRRYSLLTRPVLAVSKAMSLTIDARRARPISVTVPRAGASQLVADVGFTQKETDGSQFVDDIVAGDFTRISTAQLGPRTPAPGFTSVVGGQWGRRRPDGSTRNSPYAYVLAWFRRGGLFTGLRRNVAAGDLATIGVGMAREARGVTGMTTLEGRLADADVTAGLAFEYRYDLPAGRTTFVNNDGGAVRWTSLFVQEIPSPDPEDPTPLPVTYALSTPVNYRPGHRYRESWNRGVFSPALPPRPFPDSWITRSADTLTIFLPLWGDGAGREGSGLMATARSMLRRDGRLIGAQDEVLTQYPVPAAPGRYELRLDYTRQAPATLTTRTSIAWTFRSAHVPGPGPVPLPVSVIRFTPDLDQDNRARTANVLPVHVVRQPDSAAGPAKRLAVQVSYDDGAHWFPVRVTRRGDGGMARWPAPAGHGFVSLRAVATDANGNTVDQTLIRAYRY